MGIGGTTAEGEASRDASSESGRFGWERVARRAAFSPASLLLFFLCPFPPPRLLFFRLVMGRAGARVVGVPLLLASNCLTSLARSAAKNANAASISPNDGEVPSSPPWLGPSSCRGDSSESSDEALGRNDGSYGDSAYIHVLPSSSGKVAPA